MASYALEAEQGGACGSRLAKLIASSTSLMVSNTVACTGHTVSAALLSASMRHLQQLASSQQINPDLQVLQLVRHACDACSKQTRIEIRTSDCSLVQQAT